MSVSLIFFSCSKDNEDRIPPDSNTSLQSIYSVVDISNSPGIDTYMIWTSGTSQTQIQVLTGSFSYTTDIWSVAWPIGGILPYSIQIILNSSATVIGCADIEIRTYNNNDLIDTQNFQMGVTQSSPSPIYCDPLVAGNVFTKSLDVIAN